MFILTNKAWCFIPARLKKWGITFLLNCIFVYRHSHPATPSSSSWGTRGSIFSAFIKYCEYILLSVVYICVFRVNSRDSYVSSVLTGPENVAGDCCILLILTDTFSLKYSSSFLTSPIFQRFFIRFRPLRLKPAYNMILTHIIKHGCWLVHSFLCVPVCVGLFFPN